MKSRIEMQDNIFQSIFKLSEGNPGAATVMAACMKDGGKIDPDDFMGGLGVIFSLDTYRIYGPEIWMLYKDCCGQDLTRFLAALRAVQLGLYRIADLQKDIQSGTKLFLVSKVQETLPKFGQYKQEEVACPSCRSK